MTTFRLLGTVAEASLEWELHDNLGGSLRRLSWAALAPGVAARNFPGETVGTGFLCETYEEAKLDIEGAPSGIPEKELVPEMVVVTGTTRCLLAAHQGVVEGHPTRTPAGPSAGSCINGKRGRHHRNGNRMAVDPESSTRRFSGAQIVPHERTRQDLRVGGTAALRSPVGAAPTAAEQLVLVVKGWRRSSTSAPRELPR